MEQSTIEIKSKGLDDLAKECQDIPIDTIWTVAREAARYGAQCIDGRGRADMFEFRGNGSRFNGDILKGKYCGLQYKFDKGPSDGIVAVLLPLDVRDGQYIIHAVKIGEVEEPDVEFLIANITEAIKKAKVAASKK